MDNSLILIMGVTGLIMGIAGRMTLMRTTILIALLSAIMAIVGGCLGIVGAREGEIKKRHYPKTFIFIVSITGFIFALLLLASGV